MSEDDRPHTYEESPATGVDSPHVTTTNGTPTDPVVPHDEYPAYDHYTARPVYRPPANGGRPTAYDPPPAVYGEPSDLERTVAARRSRRARDARPPRSPRPPRARRTRRGGGDGGRPRVKKLRLLIVLIPLGLLAIVSAFFGAVMSITSDLQSLEKSYISDGGSANSKLLALDGEQLGLLTDNTNRVLVTGAQIPREMKWAIVSVEDKRFYTNSGVDLKGIARAFLADLLHQQAQQGASTITQQFVKNALAAQGKRTVFEKLREAALAYHLTRQWSKDKILTEYLNSIYFGNGAYGIESAARTYFGNDPTSSSFNCGTTGQPLCVTTALNDPANAALIAGMVASPTAFDPVNHPVAATGRRNLVLKDMYEQSYISYSQYRTALAQTVPAGKYIEPPQPKVKEPGAAYFTTWVRQQVIDRYGPEKAFDGGLTIHTTLDLQLQEAAEAAVNDYLANPAGPAAAVVAIDNQTGEVRAMVGGRDYNTTPFNLATQGERQPGSAFKPFVLAQALKEGISPNSIWPSEKRTFIVKNTHGQETFTVHNDDSNYAGTRSLAQALTYSDNSVFAAVGIQAGTKKIAKVAHEAGIRTPVSTNDAMTIGGLTTGVTPVDMAHAYETLAEGGKRISGTLGTDKAGPVGISSVKVPGHPTQVNKLVSKQVIPADIVSTEDAIMHTVLTEGTGTAAQFGVYAAGKTGTTSNYADAWFVAFTSKLTVAVWVGYPNKTTSMTTDFEGGPVSGGTFPALIWRDFMVRAYNIFNTRAAATAAKNGTTGETSTDETPDTTSTQPTDTGPSTTDTTNGSATNDTNQTNQTNGTADQGTADGTDNGTQATGTGTQNPTAPTDGTGTGAPATPTPGTATPAPSTPVTPPASTPSPGASGGASAPTG
ncbi:MAG TPA: transglycosylase domain-containing protein [Solirubrobacteraceae bacterium]|jgi:penicillin-binding protein 1A|nr:transglycosylase domain-containing protein [Solirubrobacteraceae bacterium]